MNFYINQSIQINFIKIGGITNSSVLQIGSAGIIKPASYLSNTGGFTGPAPHTLLPGVGVIGGEQLLEAPAVPLHSAGR
ncbi:spore germination protein GerPB [Bacillus sp. DTU_2020_1000418_1_SI_GHA_SEK_038]|uniref:spore germination protein GerPB n=1 Tax=Bacillus sp. DTU_2020_1000418_1_SI_GHA_SEK_038 TaxID=3077585 RepID=UPI0028E522C7|nr:spore germination protein GerPB [Bacillus sp. DTU_2020_1000418_1_SI_GHA_SEK_038]WNS76820.1 spore germination protein GerPB [Bacillus sp. DTU_2020_1000418_1_SI_GHA_SEK_038]